MIQIYFFVILIFSMMSGAQAEETVIVLENAQINKTSISIPHFNGMELNETEEMRKVIQDDLKFTGLFEIIDPKDQTLFEKETLNTEGIHFKEWLALGTEFLIKGEVKHRPKQIIFEARLYDVRAGRIILGKKIKGIGQDVRTLAHRFSNAVVKTLTGKEGIFLTKILFISDRSGDKELYMMDYDGTNIEQLTKHKSLILSPAWSSDGRFVSYSTYETHENHVKNIDLSVLDLDSRSRRIVSKQVGLNTGACWSSKRKEMAVNLSIDGNPEIYIMSTDGKKMRRLTHHPAVDVECDWAPDGNRVVFSSGRARYAHLFVMNREGTELERLTYAGRYNSSPSWSPSGDNIAFAGYKKGAFDLYVIRSDGTDLRRLTQSEKRNQHNEGPSFSPDGRHIIFASNRSGKYELYVINEDGTNERPLLKKFGNTTLPKWSPYLE